MKKAAHAPKEGQEEGVCILCGGEKYGYPAKVDLPISLARKAREILRMEMRHSIACKKCLPLCTEKRVKFEKELRNYRIGAAVFALVVIAGGFYFKRAELWLAVPVILGGAIMLLLPYGRYFPIFSPQD